MNPPKTVIFECLYAQGQVPSEPLLAPLRIANEHPQWREMQGFLEIYRRGDWRENDFTGMFSPKFRLKAKMGVDRFVAFVADNAQADVCLINPFPQIAFRSFNVWMQGEHAHPGLCRASQALLDAVGLGQRLGLRVGWAEGQVPRHGPGLLAYGNFWVARPAFWQAYVGQVLEPIADFLLREPSHPATLAILQPTTHTDPSPFLPFMIERLFSTFLSLQPQWKVAAFSLEDQLERYCSVDFERSLLAQSLEQVRAADALGQFTPELVALMDRHCGLWQSHFFDYYRERPHPHTGRPVAAQPPRSA